MSYPGFDSPPGFGFTSSQLPMMPTTLDQINPSYYNQISQFIATSGGRLSSIFGCVLYDTLRIDPGTQVVKDFTFFQNAENQQQALFISGTPYTKQKIDISPWVATGGQLSKGYEALLWEMTVQYAITSAPDTSLQPNGTAYANLALDPGLGEPVTNSGNLMRAYQESTYFEFSINQTPFENGPGWRFPSGFYGISGDAGGSLTNGWANNGCGWPYQFPVMRHLPELTRFGVLMKLQNPFIVDAGMTVRIRVALGGLMIGPVTG